MAIDRYRVSRSQSGFGSDAIAVGRQSLSNEVEEKTTVKRIPIVFLFCFVLFFFFGGSVSFRSAIFFSFVLVLSSGPLPFSFLSLSLSLSISLSESQLLLLFTRHPLTASWTTIQPEEIHDISKKKQPEDLSETYYYFFF